MILIAGGGIGGLVLSLMLHQRGIACKILEASREMHEIGVGINVLPNAVRELAGLGLLPALDAAGSRTRELRYDTRFTPGGCQVPAPAGRIDGGVVFGQ